jgi:hypothetical protein
MVSKKEASRTAAIKLKDLSVRKLELKTIQGHGYDGSSSDFETQKMKKTKTGGSNMHNNLHVLVDMGVKKAEAMINSAQQKASDKKCFFQWKKECADRDEAHRDKEIAHRDKEIEVRKMEAENRKLELELQIAVMKEKNNNN